MDSIISTKNHKPFRFEKLSAVGGREHTYMTALIHAPLLLIDTAVVPT